MSNVPDWIEAISAAGTFGVAVYMAWPNKKNA